MKSWVTPNLSRDEGVDAVVVNEDPITGGLCVIRTAILPDRRSRGRQCPRRRHERQACSERHTGDHVIGWAVQSRLRHRNGRMTIIEGRQIRHLLKEHLDLDVLIGLERLHPTGSPMMLAQDLTSRLAGGIGALVRRVELTISSPRPLWCIPRPAAWLPTKPLVNDLFGYRRS